jgi:hypothetical protein
MSQSAPVARESGGDLPLIMIFSLLGFALSLLAIGRASPIAEYTTDLQLLVSSVSLLG